LAIQKTKREQNKLLVYVLFNSRPTHITYTVWSHHLQHSTYKTSHTRLLWF